MDAPLQLTGIGLRPPHYTAILEQRPNVAWLEVHSENYFGEGGHPLVMLEKIRQHYPMSLHGVSLSLGSADELNWQHLKKLKELIDRVQPGLVSEHLSWSSIKGHYLHDLLPLPYTKETVAHVVARIQQVQDFLKRQILIENISSYIQYPHSVLSEHEFLKDIVQQSGCGILLDINNIYVNAHNLELDAHAYLHALPAAAIQEIHLAGFTIQTIEQQEVLIDTHNQPVAPAVWNLFREAIDLYGPKPTIIEWDNDLPALNTLCAEARHAEKIMRENHVTRLTA